MSPILNSVYETGTFHTGQHYIQLLEGGSKGLGKDDRGGRGPCGGDLTQVRLRAEFLWENEVITV